MRACEQSELRSLDRSPIRLHQLEPLERLERRVPRVQLRPGLKEQQVQVPLGVLQQELGE